MTAFDALLGTLSQDGMEVELGSGLNFSGATVARNPATGKVDVTIAASDPSTRLPAPGLAGTSNATLSGVQVVDGIATNTLAANTPVLLVAQTAPGENGYWLPNNAGSWTRPAYYDSDADVAAVLGQLSGAALGGTLNKSKSYYALSGATIAGAKTWLPGKAPPVIHANEAPWNLTGNVADDATTVLASLFAYAAVSGTGTKIAFGPGVYKTTAPIVLGRYISIEGAGRISTEIRYSNTVLGDTFKLSEILNVGGGHHGKISHIKISNSFVGYQPPIRANSTAYTLGTFRRCTLPGLQLLECTTAGTSGTHVPIGELSPLNPPGMVLTGTANADKTPVVVVTSGGYFGTMAYRLSVDNGATLDATVHTTALLNSDNTYKDFDTATFPSSGTLGVRLMSRAALANSIYGAATLNASFTQPSVGANVQIEITGTDPGAGDSINSTRLTSTGFVYVNGGGLYSLVSIDTALKATVKLVTAVAAPAATVGVSWCGQAWYPAPRVEVIGSPPSDTWAFDPFITSANGKLGAVTFRFSSRTIADVDRGKAQAFVPEAPTITTSAGAYYDYTDSGGTTPSGCTIRFHTGYYQTTLGYQYTTPHSVSSMVVGSTITDGTCVWTVREGPEALRCNGRGFLTLDDVWLEGGMSGLFLSQSESVVVRDTVFNAQLACGGYCSNGDSRLGEYGEFTNGVTFEGCCAWYTLGYGIVYDGGLAFSVGGNALFQSCPYGAMYLAGASGGRASGFYNETAPVLVRNCSVFTRRPLPFGLSGFDFSGFYAGSAGGVASFDMYYSDAVSWIGGMFGGSSYGILGAQYVTSGLIDSSRHVLNLPVADTAFSCGRQVYAGQETNTYLSIHTPTGQTLANGANDLAAPGTFSDIDISGPSAAFSIRGAPIGKHGQRVTYRYFGAQQLTLTHESGTPAAGLRLMCPNARDLVLPAAPTGGYVEFTLVYRTGSINRHVVESATQVRPTNNAQSGTSYTAAIGDADKCVDFSNGAATAWTIPPNSGVPFLPGTVLSASQLGAGAVTVTAGSGVTLRLPPGKTAVSAGQYATFGARLTETADTWVVFGNLA